MSLFSRYFLRIKDCAFALILLYCLFQYVHHYESHRNLSYISAVEYVISIEDPIIHLDFKDYVNKRLAEHNPNKKVYIY